MGLDIHQHSRVLYYFKASRNDMPGFLSHHQDSFDLFALIYRERRRFTFHAKEIPDNPTRWIDHDSDPWRASFELDSAGFVSWLTDAVPSRLNPTHISDGREFYSELFAAPSETYLARPVEHENLKILASTEASNDRKTV